MKLSEIARYWAAKELTRISQEESRVAFNAPFACPDFTVQIPGNIKQPPRGHVAGETATLDEVSDPLKLKSGTWVKTPQGAMVCFDLPKGSSSIA